MNKKYILCITIFLIGFQLDTNAQTAADTANNLIKIGDSLFAKKIYSQSIFNYEKSTKYSKPTASLFYKMAVAADSSKNSGKMAQYYEKAYEADKTNLMYQNSAGQLYSNYRQWQKAIEVYENCATCTNRDINLGKAYQNTENYKKALDILAPIADKGNAEACYILAKIYEENDDMKKAGGYYMKALENQDAKGSWLFEGAMAAYNATDYKLASTYFERAEKKGYTLNKDIKILYALSLMSCKKMDEGETLLRPILEQTVNPSLLYKQVGSHLYDVKNYDRAIAYFELAFKKDEKDAMALYQAGLCFIAKGEKFKKQGQNMCDKAIMIDPKLQSLKSRQGSGGPGSAGNFGL